MFGFDEVINRFEKKLDELTEKVDRLLRDMDKIEQWATSLTQAVESTITISELPLAAFDTKTVTV